MFIYACTYVKYINKHSNVFLNNWQKLITTYGSVAVAAEFSYVFLLLLLLCCVMKRHTDNHTHTNRQTHKQNDPLSRWHLIVVLHTVLIIITQNICIIPNFLQFIEPNTIFVCVCSFCVLLCLCLCLCLCVGNCYRATMFFYHSGHIHIDIDT